MDNSVPEHIRNWPKNVGDKLPPAGDCDKSPDGMHHFTARRAVNQVCWFVCDHCDQRGWDRSLWGLSYLWNDSSWSWP